MKACSNSWTNNANRHHQNLRQLFKSLAKRIQRKAAKRTEIFKQNPFHAILQTEKLHPKTHGVWSFRVDYDYRIVFKFLAADIAEFRFIGHHNKIYDYPIFLD